MKASLKDPNKYCTFYKDTGHWTRDYQHFKWEIEHLLSKGYLGNMVDKIGGSEEGNWGVNNLTN